MPPRDDDYDWLYGRDRQQPSQPEETRAFDPDELYRAQSGPTAEPPAAPPRRPERPVDPSVRPVPPPSPQEGGRVAGARGGGGSGRGPGGPGSPTGGGRRPPRKRRTGRVVAGVIITLLVLILVGLVAVPMAAWARIDRVDNEPNGDRPPEQPGTAILMVGSDSREGLTPEEQKRLGTGSTAGQRTDTIMIMYVPPSGSAALISLPRDSYLDIPGEGKRKLNTSFAIGGPKLLTETVEQNTGLRMDGYLEVGFGGFVDVIDAVGGIELCIPKDLKDKKSRLNVKKGCQTLDGPTALAYVRMRYADPRGDLGRMDRQRELISAVAKKAASPGSVLNPARYTSLVNAGADSVTLGQDTTFGEVFSAALAMGSVAGGGGTTLTVPISDPNRSTPSGSSMIWDDEKVEALFADLARGDTSRLDQYVTK